MKPTQLKWIVWHALPHMLDTENLGGRAQLRRAHHPTEAMAESAYWAILNWAQSRASPEETTFLQECSAQQRVGAALLALVTVREHTDIRVAERMAGRRREGEKEHAESVIISKERFRRILRLDPSTFGWEGYVRTIRRSLQQLDYRVNTSDLFQSIVFWNDSTRRRWAQAYYVQANKILIKDK